MLEKYSYIKLPTEKNIKNIKDILCLNSKEKTFEHISNVADTCVQIAEKFGVNKEGTEKVRICGLLHDISAVIKPDDMMIYAIENGWDIDESEKKFPFILHQRISAVIAAEDFNIKDPIILSAIACHSTLKYNPSYYDMILFLSDKLSWDQAGIAPFYDVVSEALEKSLHFAVYTYFDFTIKNNMILYPHKWFKEAKNWLDIDINKENTEI